MAEQFLTLWQVIAAAMALPGTGILGVGLFTLYKKYIERKDGKVDRAQTHEEKLQAAALAASVQLSDANKWIVTNMQTAMTECEKDKDRAWGERDRYFTIANYWYHAWRDTLHEIRNLQQIVMNNYERMKNRGVLREGEEAPKFIPPGVPPPMESPAPRPNAKE